MSSSGQAAPPGGLLARSARRAMTHRCWPLALATLAVVLTLPSLRAGWILDDHYHRWAVLGSRNWGDVLPPTADIWRFFDGDPRRTQRMMDIGLVPWWTYKHIKGAFWRPLAALTHVLDYHLWPDSPALMHAHNLLWLAALVAAVALLHRRLVAAAWVAGLAALLYAVDDARGVPAAMLANRNALLAALFGVLAIWAHDRWRRDRWRAGALLGPLLLGAALLSAEAGIGACAYLIAHALFLDRGRRRQRWAALLPYAAVLLVWAVMWRSLGYGVFGMEGVYDDPFADPLRFPALVLRRAPLLLLGQWALPPAEFSLFIGPAGAKCMWVAGLVLLPLLTVALLPLLRRDPRARFWASGMLMALVPLCATYPMNRQLFFVGLGASALLAQFLAGVFGRRRGRPRSMARRIPAASLGVLFILIHLVIAPLGLALFAAYPLGPKSMLQRFHDFGSLGASVENQDLVLVNHPLPAQMIHILGARAVTGRPLPRHTRVLAPTWSALTIRRPDARTLVIRPQAGYLANATARLFRSPRHPMALGQRVVVTGMSVTVTELTPDRRPAEASFEFAVPPGGSLAALDAVARRGLQAFRSAGRRRDGRGPPGQAALLSGALPVKHAGGLGNGRLTLVACACAR